MIKCIDRALYSVIQCAIHATQLIHNANTHALSAALFVCVVCVQGQYTIND